MRIVTSFEKNEVEIRDFLSFHLSKMTKMKQFYFIFSLIIFVASMVVAIFKGLNSISILLFISSIIMLLLYPIQKKSMIRKALQETTKYHQEVVFTEDGIFHNYAERSVKYDYDTIYKVCETKRYIYLYINPDKALFVSKYSLTSLDREQLVNYLMTRVDKQKYQLYKIK